MEKQTIRINDNGTVTVSTNNGVIDIEGEHVIIEGDFVMDCESVKKLLIQNGDLAIIKHSDWRGYTCYDCIMKEGSAIEIALRDIEEFKENINKLKEKISELKDANSKLYKNRFFNRKK